MVEKKTYIVAVSGGVDSVSLLHMLMSRKTGGITYVAAHFDHGIRSESHKDAELVKKLAGDYGLECEIGHGKLGPGASEAAAREARYDFLRKIKEKHKAEKIITAHHQDDLLETMVINILRGTGPRGLAPMSGDDILRPLLNKTKAQLTDYAKQNKLTWNEDVTNEDEKYLRNYVRQNIMPKLEPAREKLLRLNKKTSDVFTDVDIRLRTLLPEGNILYRPKFVVLPWGVQKEIVRSWLIQNGVEDIDRVMVEKVAMACKTLPAGKKIDVGGKHWLQSQPQNLLLTTK